MLYSLVYLDISANKCVPTQNTDIINKKLYILLFIIYLAPKLLNILIYIL